MLKPRKRLTKRQIKQDKFVTYYFKTQEFISQNSRYVIWGVSALAAIIIVSFIYSRKQLEREQNAVVELARARIEYFSQNYEAAVSILNNLVESYGDTESGKEGTYFLANTYFNQHSYDRAEELFKQYLNKDGDLVLEAAALAGVAACYEEKGNLDEAARTYQEAAEKYSEGFMAPQNLYDSARCFLLAGNSQEAANILTKLIENYSNSQIKNDAELLLAEVNL